MSSHRAKSQDRPGNQLESAKRSSSHPGLAESGSVSAAGHTGLAVFASVPGRFDEPEEFPGLAAAVVNSSEPPDGIDGAEETHDAGHDSCGERPADNVANGARRVQFTPNMEERMLTDLVGSGHGTSFLPLPGMGESCFVLQDAAPIS